MKLQLTTLKITGLILAGILAIAPVASPTDSVGAEDPMVAAGAISTDAMAAGVISADGMAVGATGMRVAMAAIGMGVAGMGADGTEDHIGTDGRPTGGGITLATSLNFSQV
jgi:hypothetical protein